MKRREAVFWGAVSCAPVLAGLLLTGGPKLKEDSYQYLSTAANLAAGNGASTSILHYDVDRLSGSIPAPLTMWPPGYPMAVAALNVVGVPLETAAGLVSGLAFVALVTLLVVGAGAFGLTPTSIRVMLLWLLANSWSFVYPSAASTESLFTAVATAAVVLYAFAERRGDVSPRPWSLVTAGALIGIAYWIRYAGLLLLAGSFTFYGLKWAIRRDRASARSLVYATGAGAVLIGLNALRNTWITGSWKAGYDTPVTHPLAAILRQFAASLHHLFLGEATVARLGPLEGLLLMATLFLAGLWVLQLRSARLADWRPRLLVLAFVGTYSAGIIYIAMSSMITFGTRMFFPLLPLLLLGLGAGLSDVERSWVTTPAKRWVFWGTLAAATVAYGVINTRNISRDPRSAPHYMVLARLTEPVTLDRMATPSETKPARFPMHAWIDEHIPKDATIVASDGQATSYAVNRRVVSLVESGFSKTAWTEESVRQVMVTYHAEFLVLYPRAHAWRIPVQAESAFLAALIRGTTPPWLTLVADNGEVQVYRASF